MILIPLLGLVQSSLLFALLENLLTPFALTVVLVASLVLVDAGLIFFVMKRRRASGRMNLSNGDTQVQVASLLKKLQTQRHYATFGGVIIIKVPDDDWQASILTILANATIVIIDISDLTESLRWELSAAAAQIPPQRIIVTCALKEEHAEPEYERMIRGRLSEFLPQDLAMTFPICFYPETLGRRRLFVPKKDFAQSLQRLLQSLTEGVVVHGSDTRHWH
jgi:hypothetical protein